MGSDGMNPKVLKELADVVTKTLSMIFEKSQQSGEVLGDWEGGNIVLTLKKGRKEDSGNSDLTPHPWAWEDHRTDPSQSCAKAHR